MAGKEERGANVYDFRPWLEVNGTDGNAKANEMVNQYLENPLRNSKTVCINCGSETMEIMKGPMTMDTFRQAPYEQTPKETPRIRIFFIGIECQSCAHVHLLSAPRVLGLI